MKGIWIWLKSGGFLTEGDRKMIDLKERIRKLNRVIIYLTLSDVFSWGTYSIIGALTGLYLSSKLGQDTIQFVGIGTAIYFFTRAIFQIPIGHITDRIKKDKDEIYLLILGTILMGIPFLFYAQISQPVHYYILQFLFGLGVALNVTNWRKLFALNIDGGREGRQYAAYDTVMSICTGLISIIGGLIANIGDLYFDLVISISGILIIGASIWSLLIYKYENRNSK